MNKKKIIFTIVAVFLVIALIIAGGVGFVVYRATQISSFAQENVEVLEKADMLVTRSVEAVDNLESQEITEDLILSLKNDNQELAKLSDKVNFGPNQSTKEAGESLQDFIDQSVFLMEIAVNYLDLAYCYQSLETGIQSLDTNVATEREVITLYYSLIEKLEDFQKCSEDISDFTLPEDFISALVKANESLEGDFSEENILTFGSKLEVLEESVVLFREQEELRIQEYSNKLQSSLTNLENKFESIEIF